MHRHSALHGHLQSVTQTRRAAGQGQRLPEIQAQAQYEPMEYTPSGQVQHLTISSDHQGQRIDNFLISRLKGVPKTRIYRMLRSGEVRLNGGRVQADTRLEEGQTLRIPPVRVGSTEPSQVEGAVRLAKGQKMASELEVIREEEDWLAIDKPAGVAVHGGSGVSLGAIESLRLSRPGQALELVHRLDRDTSGLLLLAKGRAMLLSLHRQLREGLMRKRYLAVVVGHWKVGPQGPTMLIKAPLKKVLGGNAERMVRVDPEGQASITRVRFLAHGALSDGRPVSLLQCEPLTGRTHQIRVHLQSQGFPILGDPKYGGADINASAAKLGLKRMFLHAWRLDFTSKSGTRIQLAAEPTQAFHTQLRLMGLNCPVSPPKEDS